MTYIPYSEKLKDPRWQKRRLELLNAADWTCKACDTKTKSLHVHHGYYKRKTEPWDYPDDVMHVLCEDCHAEMQAALARVHQRIGAYPFAALMALDSLLLCLSFAGKSTQDILLIFANIVGEAVSTDTLPHPAKANGWCFDFEWILTSVLRTAVELESQKASQKILVDRAV